MSGIVRFYQSRRARDHQTWPGVGAWMAVPVRVWQQADQWVATLFASLTTDRIEPAMSTNV